MCDHLQNLGASASTETAIALPPEIFRSCLCLLEGAVVIIDHLLADHFLEFIEYKRFEHDKFRKCRRKETLFGDMVRK